MQYVQSNVDEKGVARRSQTSSASSGRFHLKIITSCLFFSPTNLHISLQFVFFLDTNKTAGLQSFRSNSIHGLCHVTLLILIKNLDKRGLLSKQI